MLVVNKGLKPHYAEKTINHYINIISVPPSINGVLNLSVNKTTLPKDKTKKQRRYGLPKGISNNKNYAYELSLMKEYEENFEFRQFHKEQLSGTIFAHEGSEGDIL